MKKEVNKRALKVKVKTTRKRKEKRVKATT
jgi:hypothetical protein